MKNKIFLVFGAVFLFSLMAISSQDILSKDLVEGKNLVFLNLSRPIYAGELVRLNPFIEAISYSQGNETIGYVNVFGGIGRNFAIEEREYEIISSKNSDLIVPG